MPKALSMNKEKNNNRTCANLTVMDTFSACHPFLNFFSILQWYFFFFYHVQSTPGVHRDLLCGSIFPIRFY